MFRVEKSLAATGGIIAGEPTIILQGLRKHRRWRLAIDKLSLAALEATFATYWRQ